MKTTSRLAIAAAASLLLGGYSMTPAKAADLGGDCCADLEERVAELEATTVRKGNRKVSVTLYGWVNAGVIWWDNGEESDVYVIDVDAAVSRLGVKGSGKLRPGWEAGYKIELATPGPAEMGFVAEDDSDDGTGGVRVRKAEVWVMSEQLGTVTIGQGDTASDGIIDGVDLSGAGGWISYNGHADWVFSYTVTGAPALWGFMSAFDSGRQNRIRYDTPTWEGFSFSSSWGEDDQYDLAARYSKDWNGVSVAAAVGYYWSNDENVPDGEFDVWGGSASIYHAASGLFFTGSYAHEESEIAGLSTSEADQYFLKAGIRGNWTGMGETSVYGEYGNTEVDTPFGAGITPFGAVGNFALGGTLGAAVTSADGDMWGVGVGQDLDAVGATAYLGYRHLEADVDVAGVGVPTEDIDAVLAGMVVPF